MEYRQLNKFGYEKILGQHVFPSRVNDSRHLSTRPYARIVAKWADISDWRPQDTERIPSSRQKRRLYIGERKTFALYNSCLGAPSSKALCSISGSRQTIPLRSRNKRRSNPTSLRPSCATVDCCPDRQQSTHCGHLDSTKRPFNEHD